MLPDVCLYSGKEGKGLSRSTKLLRFCPLWIKLIAFGAFVAFVLLSQMKGLGPGFILGLGTFVGVTFYCQKSVVIHHAYSLSSFLKRTMMAAVFLAAVYFTLRLSFRTFDSGFIGWIFGGTIFALLIVVTPRIHDFRVKLIQEKWVTLAGVHPTALKALGDHKEACRKSEITSPEER